MEKPSKRIKNEIKHKTTKFYSFLNNENRNWGSVFFKNESSFLFKKILILIDGSLQNISQWQALAHFDFYLVSLVLT